MTMCSCGLKEGDAVDWWYYSEKLGRNTNSQRRRWHGVIVEDKGRNSDTSLHDVVVSWTAASNWHPYKEGDHVVHPEPGFRQTIACRELLHCVAPRMTPTHPW